MGAAYRKASLSYSGLLCSRFGGHRRRPGRLPDAAQADRNHTDRQRMPAGRPQVLLQGQLQRGPAHRRAPVHQATKEPHRVRAQRVGSHAQVGAGHAWQLLRKARHAQPSGERLFVAQGQVPQPYTLGDTAHAGALASADIHLPQHLPVGIKKRAVLKWHVQGYLSSPVHIHQYAGMADL